MDTGARNYQRYLSGQDVGFVELITEYQQPLFQFLCGYVRDEGVAEELTEEVFFRIAVKKPHFRGASDFRTWLFSIGRNLALDHLRRQKRHTEIPFTDAEPLLSLYDSTVDTYEQKERRRQLYDALAKLPAREREALHLTYFAGFSCAAVGEIVKKNRRGVENLLYRARKRLKAELEKGGFMYEEL